MNERGSFSDRPEHSRDEQKERIKSALLTPGDTWLSDILREDFAITDQWLATMNDKLLVAGMHLDGHDLTKHAQEVKTKRKELFAELAKVSKSEALAKAFNSYGEINSQPLAIFENARYLSQEGFNIANILTRAYYLLYFKTSVLTERVTTNKSVFGEELALRLMSQNPQALLGNPDNNTLKMSALAKMNETFHLSDDTADAINKAPRLMANALAKNIAIARIAFEFCEPEGDITVSQINTALAQPLDSHMLTLIESRSYSLNHAQYYRKKVPEEERRERVLKQLSSGTCRMLGGNVLRSYFRAAPLSEAEKENYPGLNESYSRRFREYNQPFTNKRVQLTEADLESLSQISSKPPEEMSSEWVAFMNHLLRRGSRDARPQGLMKEHNPVTRARSAFFEQLGWNAADHPLNSKIRENAKKIRPDSTILLMRLATDYNYDPLEFLSRCPVQTFEAPADRTWIVKKVLSAYERRSNMPLDIDFIRKVLSTSTLAHVTILAYGCDRPLAGMAYVQDRPIHEVKKDLRDLLEDDSLTDEELLKQGMRFLEDNANT